MKILHIGQMIGGLDIYIRNSIIYNNVEDNEYVIVCGKDDKHQLVIRNGIEVKEYPISLFRSLNPLNDLKALMEAVKIIRKEKPDVIHCHSAKGGIIGRTAGWITGVKTFYTPHAFSYLCTPSRLKRWVFMTIERLTRFKTYVLACSESEQEMAIKEVGYSKEHALAWHNAVPDSSLERGKMVDISEPYACYIGRPCYQKNPLFLLDVIKKVKDRGCNLKFILLGVGYHSPELDAMKAKMHDLGLEDSIRLEPWINHADCQEFVRKSLFYISTALYEGLPLAIIEAMANGKAIIASDVVGNKDCVRNGENGYLLPLDADAYANKIIQLVNDKELRTSMEEKSRALFLEEFFIENRIKYLQNQYNMVYNLRYGGANLVLLKTNIDNVILVSTQSKLVRCVKGRVLDVAVDIRKGSPTYGKHVAVELTEDNHRQFFIPKGFAHGFAVLSETAVFQYKCDNFYHPEADGGISILDDSLGIDWRIPTEHANLSEKDTKHPLLKEFDSPFTF